MENISIGNLWELEIVFHTDFKFHHGARARTISWFPWIWQGVTKSLIKGESKIKTIFTFVPALNVSLKMMKIYLIENSFWFIGICLWFWIKPTLTQGCQMLNNQ